MLTTAIHTIAGALDHAAAAYDGRVAGQPQVMVL